MHLAPRLIYTSQHIMQATPIGSDSEEPGSTTLSRLVTRIEELEASRKELDEWWETALEIATEVRSPELRRKFMRMAKSGREAKSQVCALDLDDIYWTHLYIPTHFLQHVSFCVSPSS